MARDRHDDTQRWRSLDRLLEAALALPEAEREGWLGALAGADREQAGTVRALLARAGGSEGGGDDTFMREPVDALGAVGVDGAGLAEPAEPADAAGDRVGPWRLLEPLGAGGMSTVWRAERADGAFRREVALKLPHAAHAGAPAQGLARRMARERDILAGLEHPGIARLYDAGVTPEGRPWLAMERIDGVPIDVHAREQQLGVRAILGGVLQVADALAHAHARLVVHRDLKPANMLVTPRGEVRLLDFGIAKLLMEDAGDAPAGAGLTQALGRALTPDYASPEQVGLRPVTVATDVYSLGIVAYELLTGERPYHVGRRSAAALEEAILAAEVPLASRRVAGTDRALARALRGDIDTVLEKALRKDPAQRYASIESFAADLRRHLDGEPILAQAPSTRVRVTKFVRRHRIPFAAGAAVLISLVASLGVALWQAHQATQFSQLAQARLVRSEAALAFAGRLIGESAVRGETLGFEQLVERAERIAGLDATSDAVLHVDAAETLASWFASYGAYERADRVLGRAIDALPARSDAAQRTALLCHRASARANLGRWEDAGADLAAAKVGVHDTTCHLVRSFVARHHNDARAALAHALAAKRAFDTAGVGAAYERAQVVATIAFAQALNGRSAEAQRGFHDATVLLQSLARAESPLAVTVWNNWAVALMHAGRPREALAKIARAEEVARRRSPQAHLPGYLHSNRGRALRLLGRHAESLVAYTRLVDGVRADPNPGYEVMGLAGSALALRALGRGSEARAAIERAEAVQRRHALHPDISALRTLQIARTHLQADVQERTRADAAFAALQARETALGLKTGHSATLAIERARIALDETRLDAAQAHLDAALAAAVSARGEFDASVYSAQAWQAMAQLHRARGDAESAAAAAERAAAQWIAAAGQAPLATALPLSVSPPARAAPGPAAPG